MNSKITIDTGNGPKDITNSFNNFSYKKPDLPKPTYLHLHSLEFKNGSTVYFPDNWELIDVKSDGNSVLISQTKHKNSL